MQVLYCAGVRYMQFDSHDNMADHTWTTATFACAFERATISGQIE